MGEVSVDGVQKMAGFGVRCVRRRQGGMIEYDWCFSGCGFGVCF